MIGDYDGGDSSSESDDKPDNAPDAGSSSESSESSDSEVSFGGDAPSSLRQDDVDDRDDLTKVIGDEDDYAGFSPEPSEAVYEAPSVHSSSSSESGSARSSEHASESSDSSDSESDGLGDEWEHSSAGDAREDTAPAYTDIVDTSESSSDEDEIRPRYALRSHKSVHKEVDKVAGHMLGKTDAKHTAARRAAAAQLRAQQVERKVVMERITSAFAPSPSKRSRTSGPAAGAPADYQTLFRDTEKELKEGIDEHARAGRMNDAEITNTMVQFLAANGVHLSDKSTRNVLAEVAKITPAGGVRVPAAEKAAIKRDPAGAVKAIAHSGNNVVALDTFKKVMLKFVSPEQLEKARGVFGNLPGYARRVLESDTAKEITRGARETFGDVTGTLLKIVPELFTFLFDLLGQALGDILPALISILVKSIMHAITVGSPSDQDIDDLMNYPVLTGGHSLNDVLVGVAYNEFWATVGDACVQMDVDQTTACRPWAGLPADTMHEHDLGTRFANTCGPAAEGDSTRMFETAGENVFARMFEKPDETSQTVARKSAAALQHAAGFSSVTGTAAVEEFRKAAEEAAKKKPRPGKPTVDDVADELEKTSDLLRGVAPNLDPDGKGGKTDRALARTVAALMGAAQMIARTVGNLVLGMLRNKEFKESVKGISHNVNDAVIKVADPVADNLAKGIGKTVKEAVTAGDAGGADARLVDEYARAFGLSLTRAQNAEVVAALYARPTESRGLRPNIARLQHTNFYAGRAIARAVPVYALPPVLKYQMRLLLLLVCEDNDNIPDMSSEQRARLRAAFDMRTEWREPNEHELLTGSNYAKLLETCAGENASMYNAAIRNPDAYYGVMMLLAGLATDTGALRWIERSPEWTAFLARLGE